MAVRLRPTRREVVWRLPPRNNCGASRIAFGVVVKRVLWVLGYHYKNKEYSSEGLLLGAPLASYKG